MNIQKLRLQRGWSQEQLAALSGVSVRTIQRLETGQPPSLETRKALGAVFGINPFEETPPDMPATTTSPTPEEQLAFRHVRRVKGFYIHATQYVLVNSLLIAINLLTWHHYFWAIWPILGWGIGLASHGLRTFDAIPFLSGDWEKRAVEQRLGRKL